MHPTLYNVQCTPCNVYCFTKCTLYNVNCTLPCILYNFTEHSVQNVSMQQTPYTIWYQLHTRILYVVHCTVYTMQTILYDIVCIVCTVQCTMYTFYSLHTAQCTL